MREGKTDRRMRQRLNAPAADTEQDLFVSPELKTGRVLVKDEDVCLHCGLCAERCPTGAIVWLENKQAVRGGAAKKILRKSALPILPDS